MHSQRLAQCPAQSKSMQSTLAVDVSVSSTMDKMWKSRIKSWSWTGDDDKGKSQKLANWKKKQQEMAHFFFFF